MNLRRVAELIERNGTHVFTARGRSMAGKVEDGQRVTVDRVLPRELKEIRVGQVVLAKVKGRLYLHLVKAVDERRGFLICNAKGKENGWTKAIIGRKVG